MNLFISWSGDLSREVALILREWIPSVVQAVKPFMSSEDIAKGARWFDEIATSLQESAFGIVCLTRENRGSEWINFEAGAVAMRLDRANVTALLIDIPPSEVVGPMAHFQHTQAHRDDVWKLLKTLNTRIASPLPEDRLRAAFEVWFPRLDKLLKESLESARSATQSSPRREERDILEELLILSRATAAEVAMRSSRRAPPPLEPFARLIVQKFLPRVVDELTEKEARMIRLYFGAEDGLRMTYAELAALHGVSEIEVGRTLDSAVGKVLAKIP